MWRTTVIHDDIVSREWEQLYKMTLYHVKDNSYTWWHCTTWRTTIIHDDIVPREGQQLYMMTLYHLKDNSYTWWHCTTWKTTVIHDWLHCSTWSTTVIHDDIVPREGQQLYMMTMYHVKDTSYTWWHCTTCFDRNKNSQDTNILQEHTICTLKCNYVSV